MDWIEVVNVVGCKGCRHFSLCDIKWFLEMNRLSLPKQEWVEVSARKVELKIPVFSSQGY